MFIKKKEYDALVADNQKWRDIAMVNAEALQNLTDKFDALAREAQGVNDLNKKINKQNEELIAALKEREKAIRYWQNETEKAQKKAVELALIIDEMEERD